MATPSSPPLSTYAVAAPLLSSDDDGDERFVDEEEDEDENFVDKDKHYVEENEKENFVEADESDPVSRWVSTELMLRS